MNNDNKKLDDCQFVVYVIWDSKNNKYYVGVTRQKYAYTRIRQHKRGKQFVDRELQKVGWENCDWWIVEENIPAENIDECEKKWIDFFDCVYPNGYNKTHGGIGNIIVSDDTREKIRQNALARDLNGENNPMYGKHHTEETKASISAKLSGENSPMYGKPPANKGVPHTEEEKAKISAANKGENNPFYGKHHTAESIEKNRQAHLGKHHSDESREKMSESHKRENLSDETRNKMSSSHTGEKNHFYGKHHTAETKALLSAKLSGKNNPMYGKSPANKGKHPNAETRAKMSESHKGKKIPDETRAKLSAAAKARWAKKKAAAENADNQTTS